MKRLMKITASVIGAFSMSGLAVADEAQMEQNLLQNLQQKQNEIKQQEQMQNRHQNQYKHQYKNQYQYHESNTQASSGDAFLGSSRFGKGGSASRSGSGGSGKGR